MAALPHIRVAFFGMSAAGKTTLVSTCFGHQQRHAFERDHGYRLAAVDARDGNRLLKNYYGMEEGRFPPPTTGADHTYQFEFKITGLPQPAFVLDWLDYPGGWWDAEPSEPEERERKRRCILQLLKSQVGFLLIDGAEYKRGGKTYLRQLFDQFKNEVRRWQDIVRAEGHEHLPVIEHWVIALTKADLFPPDFTARALLTQVFSEAQDQIEGLTEALQGAHVDPRSPPRVTFGNRFLLLSSAEADPTDSQRVLRADRTIGLELVAPAAFATILQHLARTHAAAPQPNLSWWQRALLAIREMLTTKALDSVEPRYSPLLLLVRAVGDLVHFDVEAKAADLRLEQRRLAGEGKLIEAAATAMRAELESEAGQRAFQGQRD